MKRANRWRPHGYAIPEAFLHFLVLYCCSRLSDLFFIWSKSVSLVYKWFGFGLLPDLFTVTFS